MTLPELTESTQEAVEEKPFKRYCKRGHDTWRVGRTKQNQCKTCQRASNAYHQELRTAQQQGTPEYVTILKELRESRGYTIRQIAFESGLDPSFICKLEKGKARASYPQRVKLFQALNVLGFKDSEAREESLERNRRLVRAGLA
jgi:ribosome-binding protein aMBF1 (putative translation factor)